MPKKHADPFLKKLGARVKDLRERKGLSQEDLADDAKLDRTYVSGIERGVRNPTIVTLRKVATALSTSLTALLPHD